MFSYDGCICLMLRVVLKDTQNREGVCLVLHWLVRRRQSALVWCEVSFRKTHIHGDWGKAEVWLETLFSYLCLAIMQHLPTSLCLSSALLMHLCILTPVTTSCQQRCALSVTGLSCSRCHHIHTFLQSVECGVKRWQHPTSCGLSPYSRWCTHIHLDGPHLGW